MSPLPRVGLPWRTLALAAAALAVAAAPGAASWLVLDRSGAVWASLLRALPTHLVHFSPTHLLWDVGGLLVTGAIFERPLGRRFWPVVAGSAAAAAAAVWFLVPGLDAYGGLSAILHGMALAGATLAYRRDRASGASNSAWVDLAWIVAIVAKIAIEGLSGAPLFTDPATLGAVPLPLSHAAGALGAMFLVGCCPPRARSDLPDSGEDRVILSCDVHRPRHPRIRRGVT